MIKTMRSSAYATCHATEEHKSGAFKEDLARDNVIKIEQSEKRGMMENRRHSEQKYPLGRGQIKVEKQAFARA